MVFKENIITNIPFNIFIAFLPNYPLIQVNLSPNLITYFNLNLLLYVSLVRIENLQAIKVLQSVIQVIQCFNDNHLI